MPLNPFESKRNFGAHLAELGVRNGMVADGEELASNILRMCTTSLGQAPVLTDG